MEDDKKIEERLFSILKDLFNYVTSKRFEKGDRFTDEDATRYAGRIVYEIATAKKETAREILDYLIYVMHTLDIKPDIKDYVVNELRKKYLGE